MDRILNAALQLVDGGVLVLDAGQRIVFGNKWFSERFQMPQNCLPGQPIAAIFPKWQEPRYLNILQESLDKGLGRYLSGAMHLGLFSPDGHQGTPIRFNVNVKPYTVDNRAYILLEVQDTALRQRSSASIKSFISELEQENQKSLRGAQVAQILAAKDSLTGLANRREFEVKSAGHIDLALRGGDMTAIVFIDLDNFKAINEGSGHHVGDQVLVAFSQYLEECIQTWPPGQGIAARHGGDEFALCLPGIKKAAEVVSFMESLQEYISSQPNACLNGRQIFASIGIALCPVDGDNQARLLQLADVAMRGVKYSGGNSFGFFSPALTELVQEMGARRVAELAKEETESKYYNLFRNMPEGFVYLKLLFDETQQIIGGIVLEVNEALEQIVGKKKEMLVGQQLSFFGEKYQEINSRLQEVHNEIVLYNRQPRFKVESKTEAKDVILSFHLPMPGFMAIMFAKVDQYFSDVSGERIAEKNISRWTAAQEALDQLVMILALESPDKEHELIPARALAWHTSQAIGALIKGALGTPSGSGVDIEEVVEKAISCWEPELRRHKLCLLRQGNDRLPLVPCHPQILLEALVSIFKIFLYGEAAWQGDLVLITHVFGDSLQLKLCSPGWDLAGEWEFLQSATPKDSNLVYKLREAAWLTTAAGGNFFIDQKSNEACIGILLQK